MKRKVRITAISVSLLIGMLSLSLSLAPIQANSGGGCEPKVVDLIAGQHMDAGDVTVWNDGSFLYVQYSTAGGWALVETHLAVATSLSSIPQTRRGNPKVGHFSYRMMHSYVDEYTYVIGLGDWSVGTEIYIAAHAVVVNGQTIAIVSDTSTMVTAGNVGGATYPHSAVYAWEAFNDTEPSYWDENLDHDFSASGADWIWESYRVVHPVDGDIVTFRKTFEIVCLHALTDSTLWITCDNGYEAYLNGELVGSAQLGAGWAASDLTEPYVNTDGWQSVESYDVYDFLHSGENVLEIAAANEYMGPLDGQSDGNQRGNPAGLIFELNVSSCEHGEETAWGAGEGFPGRNWAMFFTYVICGP